MPWWQKNRTGLTLNSIAFTLQPCTVNREPICHHTPTTALSTVIQLPRLPTNRSFAPIPAFHHSLTPTRYSNIPAFQHPSIPASHHSITPTSELPSLPAFPLPSLSASPLPSLPHRRDHRYPRYRRFRVRILSTERRAFSRTAAESAICRIISSCALSISGPL